MLDTLASELQFFTSIYILNQEIRLENAVAWSILLAIYHLSMKLLITAKEKIDFILALTAVICFSLPSLFICFKIESTGWFLGYFLCLMVLSIAQFAPFYCLEHKGAGGMLRLFIQGGALIQLNAIILTGYPSMQLELTMISPHLIYQAWRIISELTTFNEDNKKKLITTAILLGKHDCFKLFLTLHIFSSIYVLIDMLSESIYRGLPLLLIPWLVNLCYKVRLLRTKNLSGQTYLYMVCFYILTILGFKLS